MRVLLIEDDSNIASFIIKGLKQAGFVVDHSADGEDGLHRAQSHPYDIALIDLMLPKLSGLTVIERLREKKVNLPVIILSAKQSVDDRVAGLRQGGDDYLTKPFAFSELLARIHALLRRATGAKDATVLTYADLIVNLLTREVARGGTKIDLQAMEFSLLEYLVRNAEHLVSKTMIMEHVWDCNIDPETNVVETRMSRLRAKVDRDFQDKLIHTLRGVGYVLRKDT